MYMKPLKDLLPRSALEKLLMVATLMPITGVPLYELLVILPTIDHEETSVGHITHVLAWVVLGYLVSGHLYMMMAKDTTIRGRMLPSVLKPGWSYCYECQCNVPPRSSHCYYCRCCVLKREHHCYVYGVCIGHSNQKHYIMYLFCLWLGLLYCNVLHFDYSWEVLGGIRPLSIVAMMVPVLAWVTRIADTVTVVVAFISALCFWASILVGGFLLVHLRCVLRGQSERERKKGVSEYDAGSWRANWHAVMGRRWWVLLLCPFLDPQQPGDGVHFVARDGGPVKDM